jgi:hypothetical protein
MKIERGTMPPLHAPNVGRYLLSAPYFIRGEENAQTVRDLLGNVKAANNREGKPSRIVSNMQLPSSNKFMG